MAKRNFWTVLALFHREASAGHLNKTPRTSKTHAPQGGTDMTHHEIEEAVNQGQCFLDVDILDTGVRVTLTGPDRAVVSVAEHPWPDDVPNLLDLWEDVRATYRTLFNDVEARYSQKLCRLSGLCVSNLLTSPWAERIVPHTAYENGAGPYRFSLSENGVLLFDTLRNLKPGIPFLSPWERREFFAAASVPAAEDAPETAEDVSEKDE